MPRYTFSSGALRGAAPGLGKLASAIAGSGRAGKDAYDQELITQSRIGQAIASAQANKARAAQDEAETAAMGRRPDLFREQVALQAGVDMPTVDNFRARLRGESPQVAMGPPTEAGDMGIGSFQAGEETNGKLSAAIRQNLPLLFNLKDIKPDDLAQADKIYRDGRLSDQIIAGNLDRNTVGGAQAAAAGKELFNRDSTGSVLDQFTGALDTSNPLAASTIGLRKDQAAQARAAAAENYAQAANARASAAKTSQETQQGAKAGQIHVVTGPNGEVVLVDKLSGTARQATGADGAPVVAGGKGPKPLNEGQAKALLFGSRMAIADEIMNELAAQNKLFPNIIKQGAESVPLVGGALGMAANFGATDSEQMIEQAQRDFINAVLRRESGASIAPAEFANARIQYFPQPGDSPDVIRQKAANRRAAIEGMKADFGDAGMPRFLETVRGARAVRNAPKAQPKPAQGGEIPTVSTDADYARLPSGAQFRDPQGNLRRKQ